MSYTRLYVEYTDPDGPRKEKESSQAFIGVMREHEEEEFIACRYYLKG